MDTAEYGLLAKLSTLAKKYQLDPIILRGGFQIDKDNRVRMAIPPYDEEAKTRDYLKLCRGLESAGIVQAGKLEEPEDLQSFISGVIPLKQMSACLDNAIKNAPPLPFKDRFDE